MSGMEVRYSSPSPNRNFPKAPNDESVPSAFVPRSVDSPERRRFPSPVSLLAFLAVAPFGRIYPFVFQSLEVAAGWHEPVYEGKPSQGQAEGVMKEQNQTEDQTLVPKPMGRQAQVGEA